MFFSVFGCSNMRKAALANTGGYETCIYGESRGRLAHSCKWRDHVGWKEVQTNVGLNQEKKFKGPVVGF